MTQTFDQAAIAQPAIMWKQPIEELDRGVDFADRLASSPSITVGSVTAVLVEDGSDATSTIIAASPAPLVQPGTKIVQFRVQGGVAGKKYNITVRANGSDGQLAEFDIELNVVEFKSQI